MENLDEIDANIGGLFSKIQAWVDGFITLIPNLIAASIVLLVGWGISWLITWSVRKTLTRRGTGLLWLMSAARWSDGRS